MSLCDRRSLLFGGGALLALPACRFEPALHAERGALSPLYGQIGFLEPDTAEDFLMLQRLEDRLGRSPYNPPFDLTYSLRIRSFEVGTDAEGQEQRVHLEGRSLFELRRRGEDVPLLADTAAQFTGYSNTGNTVATRAAENDARARLISMLADVIVERLLQASPALDL